MSHLFWKKALVLIFTQMNLHHVFFAQNFVQYVSREMRNIHCNLQIMDRKMKHQQNKQQTTKTQLFNNVLKTFSSFIIIIFSIIKMNPLYWSVYINNSGLLMTYDDYVPNEIPFNSSWHFWVTVLKIKLEIIPTFFAGNEPFSSVLCRLESSVLLIMLCKPYLSLIVRVFSVYNFAVNDNKWLFSVLTLAQKDYTFKDYKKKWTFTITANTKPRIAHCILYTVCTLYVYSIHNHFNNYCCQHSSCLF